MKIALDIDDTITKHSKFFSELSYSHDCVIVTSRDNSPESIELTKQLMASLNISYSSIYFCNWQQALDDDINNILEGAERLLYQKVIACEKEQVDAIFDDDPTVQKLIRKYLPEVAIFSPV